MGNLLIGFVLGIIGAAVGDIIRTRMRDARDREILCDELRDEFQLLDDLLGTIVEQAREHSEFLGGQVGPVFSDHAKRDLELASVRFSQRMERVHLIRSAQTRRQMREFQHLLYSTSIAVRALDDREQWGLDLPDEAERAVWRSRWQEGRKKTAEQCEAWLLTLQKDARSLMKSVPS